LQEIVENYQPEGASIIVSDPRDGFILALANYPTFDPNHFSDYPVDTHRNRAVSDLYEPGSTFKIVPIAGALQDQAVSPETLVDCASATATYGTRTLSLPKDSHPMDTLSVSDVLIRSSNRGSAQLGILLGENRLHQWAAGFGFGKRLGYGPRGEVSGILHPVRNWDGRTITRLPMGHAIAATPLQVHYATSVIANGGWLMKPRVVRRVLDKSGRTVVDFAPVAHHRVIEEAVAHEIRSMMQAVLSPDGTAKRAFIPGYAAAGKTGTSQKIIDGRYSRQHHIASFSGFLPAQEPVLAITVVVDNPKMPKGQIGYGGVVAAPVFRDLGAYIARYLSIPVAETLPHPEIVRR
jgi:cell division protein FtsI/penicillin-binding protein 2